MSEEEKKRSILAEMIAFAKVDGKLKEVEHNFLFQVAVSLGMDKATFESLLQHSAKAVVLRSEADRIVQFHRLVLLMNVDATASESELHRLRNIGVHMGLPLMAIDQIFKVMHEYPNRIIPPNVLISIFKTYQN